MNIPLKIIAIYKKGNTPLVKYQETANSTCARQIFKLFFEMLSVISGKMYAEMIDAMVEKAVRQQKILSIYDPTSKAARSFEEIAKRLLDNESAALDEKRTISHVFSNFFNRKQ